VIVGVEGVEMRRGYWMEEEQEEMMVLALLRDRFRLEYPNQLVIRDWPQPMTTLLLLLLLLVIRHCSSCS
jgi:hypothetical protein